MATPWANRSPPSPKAVCPFRKPFSSDHSTQALHDLAQLGEFISAVYYRNEAFIDIDDYTMHAFRIPKKLKTDE